MIRFWTCGSFTKKDISNTDIDIGEVAGNLPLSKKLASVDATKHKLHNFEYTSR